MLLWSRAWDATQYTCKHVIRYLPFLPLRDCLSPQAIRGRNRQPSTVGCLALGTSSNLVPYVDFGQYRQLIIPCKQSSMYLWRLLPQALFNQNPMRLKRRFTVHAWDVFIIHAQLKRGLKSFIWSRSTRNPSSDHANYDTIQIMRRPEFGYTWIGLSGV